MATKKKSPDPDEKRKKALSKLEKAGAKGVTEAALLGKSGDGETLAALEKLKQDGAVVKVGAGALVQWFAASAAPGTVAESVEKECASRGMAPWNEADILKKMPKYYSLVETAAALRRLCAGPEVLKIKIGKGVKFVYLPGAEVRGGGGDYFVSEAARFIYALVKLDGENQQRELGLSQTHYRDGKLAKSWRHSIAKLIHPDVCVHPKAHEASDELDRIYHRMIG